MQRGSPLSELDHNVENTPDARAYREVVQGCVKRRRSNLSPYFTLRGSAASTLAACVRRRRRAAPEYM